MKLIQCLITNRALVVGRRRATPRFFYIAGILAGIAIIILSILLANYAGEFWDKVREIVGRELATSRYWQEVAGR